MKRINFISIAFGCVFLDTAFGLFETDYNLSIAPLLAAGLIAGGSGILSSLIGARSTKSSNDASLAAQQAANEMNYKIFKEGSEFNRQERLETQDYNRMMWELSNFYNSPAQQAVRLRASGINPSAVLSGDSGSFAPVQSTPAAAPSAAPMQGISFQPLFTSGSFENIVGSVMDFFDKYQDMRGKSIDNDTRNQRNLNELELQQQNILNQIDSRKTSAAQRKLLLQQFKRNAIEIDMLNFEKQRQNKLAQQADEMFGHNVQAMKDQHSQAMLNLAATRLNMSLGIAKNEREERALVSALSEAKARIDNLGFQNTHIDADTKLRILESELKKAGLPAAKLDAARKSNVLKGYQNGRNNVFDTILDYLGDMSLGKFGLGK